jgi:hypothetical protein
MKRLSSAVGIVALALGALATQSCEETETPHAHYQGNRYDDHPRYAPDHGYSEGGYRRPDGYEDEDHLVHRRGGDDQDEDRQPSIVIPVPGY